MIFSAPLLGLPSLLPPLFPRPVAIGAIGFGKLIRKEGLLHNTMYDRHGYGACTWPAWVAWASNAGGL